MIKFIILGITQGLTEFLPVSSSAHLVIMQKILGLNGQEVALSVVLHLGTVLALLVFFFFDLIELIFKPKWIGLIILVTLITGIIGIFGKNFFESLFSSPRIAAFGLIVTAIILILTREFGHAKRASIKWRDAFILGITQGIAIIPGVSRSGITISTLLFRGIDRGSAFRFSFLAAIPAVLGAAILEAKGISAALKTDFAVFFAGFIFSFLAGLFSLWFLKRVLEKAKLYYFGFYCIIVAILTLIFIK